MMPTQSIIECKVKIDSAGYNYYVILSRSLFNKKKLGVNVEFCISKPNGRRLSLIPASS